DAVRAADDAPAARAGRQPQRRDPARARAPARRGPGPAPPGERARGRAQARPPRVDVGGDPGRSGAQQRVDDLDHDHDGAGALHAILVAAMTAASLAGRREAMYACFAAAAGWLLARLAVRPAGAKKPARRRARKAVDGAPTGSFPERLMWALEATPRGYGI